MQRSKWILIGVSCAMGISFLIVIAYARNETGEDRTTTTTLVLRPLFWIAGVGFTIYRAHTTGG